MLASITPLGERGRGRRWGVTAGAYAAGSLLGGSAAGGASAALGALVHTAGWRPHPGATWAEAAAALVLAAAAIDAAGIRVPTLRRQVNEDWLVRYRGWVYGSGFGFQLGLGVVTLVPTAGVYATLALAALAGALTGSAAAGAAIGAAFGLARAAPLLATAVVRTPARLRRFHVQMEKLAPVSRWAAVALFGAVGLLVAVAA